MSNTQVSYFKTVINPGDIENPAHVPVDSILKAIKTGKWENKINEIRHETNTQRRSKLKARLPAIVFGGRFSSRRIDAFQESSNIICIDFDGLSNGRMDNIKSMLREYPYTYACFTSTSGRGVKALIKASFDCYESFKQMFCSIDNDLKQQESFDMANSDISRACFVSHDPDIYINPNAQTKEPVKLDWKTYLKRRRLSSPEKTFEYLTKWMDRNAYAYKEGHRNEYLFVLGSALCRYGIEQDTVKGMFLSKFQDLSETEVSNVVTSAFRSNEFGIIKMTDVLPDDEKAFYKNIDVPDFDFDPASVLADNDDINRAVHYIARGGKMFKSFGLKAMDEYLVLKRNELYGFVAMAKAGKTMNIAFLSLMAARRAGWHFLVLTTETEISDYKSILVGFILNKNIRKASEEEISKALEFIDEHFTFIHNDLDHMQVIDVYHFLATKHEFFDAIIIDPITNISKSKRLKGVGNEYYEELYVEYLKFSKKHCTMWVISHVISSKERERTHPYVQDAEYGVQMARRCHYGITMFRDAYNELDSTVLEMHVRYVRTAITKGGNPTMNEHPLKFIFNNTDHQFGYDVAVNDNLYENPLIYDNKVKSHTPIMESENSVNSRYEKDNLLHDYSSEKTPGRLTSEGFVSGQNDETPF